MIGKDSLMEKLQVYARSSVGKNKMKTCINSARKSGKTLASGAKAVDVNSMSTIANDLVGMIRSRLPKSISEVGGTLVANTPIAHPDGSYTVNLSFDKNALRRESLDNDLGYDGIDNIVALFNNGYHAKNYVYGWWDGHRPTGESLGRSMTGSEDYAWIRSKKEREALLFMQDAAAEFNAKYGAEYNVIVQLGSDYTE